MKSASIIQLANKLWQLEASTHGGQVLHASHAASPHRVIFCGKFAEFVPGKAIRGGSPVCWPWFGASPVEGRPIQGFARTAVWEVDEMASDFLRMRLPEAHVAAGLRDFPFELYSEIRLSDALELSLVMKNCGEHAVEISCALHTYFSVSDCGNISVCGLENAPFTVKGGEEQKPENKALAISGEVCRLYSPQRERVEIIDPAWLRKIVIRKENSNSTLVWNPGAERCAQIPDLADDEYRDFLCIEANRAGNDTLLLASGATETLSQKIQLSVF